MIVMKMQGGLGNQFFQYATGRAIAWRLQCPLLLDISWYRRLPRGATPRAWELGRYPINAQCLDPDDEESPWFWSMERLGCMVRLKGRLHWARSFREAGPAYDARLIHLGRNRTLEGYWQSPSYFDAISSTLRRELQPRVPMGIGDVRIAEQILSDPGRAVAVHVRRGDYLHGVHAVHHGTCDDAYYLRAFEYMRRQLVAPRFFVFSDDPGWVASRSDIFGGAMLVSHNGAESAFQDIRLMSLCRGHIIANSSFSWWGGWLSSHPDKRVVAPQQWLANGESMPFLMPAGWVRL